MAIPPSGINDGIDSGKTFEARAGAPTEIPAALGLVVLSFASLERSLSRAIAHELRAGEVAGESVAAELPFKQKLHLLTSLLRMPAEERIAPRSVRTADATWAGIVAKCFQAEELRNRLLHSNWEPDDVRPDAALRFKRSAKMKRGLYTDAEILDSASILDVAEFIDRVTVEVDHYFLPPIVT